MDLLLRGRIAWVLGASSGLGLAVAEALLAEGTRVAVTARAGERLDNAVARLAELATANDTECIALAADVTDLASLDAAHAGVVERLGAVQIAVVNGGGPAPASVLDLGDDALDTPYRLLLRPAAHLVSLVAPAMIAAADGTIAFCTSSGVREPIPRLGPSNIMRAGVTALMKTAATELGAHGVRVLGLAPGRIATDRTAQLDAATATRTGRNIDDVAAASRATIPLGRYGDTAEFGRVAAFVCSPAASYITGTTIIVDGGKLEGLLT